MTTYATSQHGIKDNHTRGRVADFLTAKVAPGSDLSVVSNDDWSTEQVVAVAVAVAELLQDLLHVIHSRYQGKLYVHWKATRITEFEVNGSNDDEGVPF